MSGFNQRVFVHGVLDPCDKDDLVLLGRGISIIPGEPADELYMSAAGKLVIVESSRLVKEHPNKLVSFRASDYEDELQNWDLAKFDSVIADYIYSIEGQAMLVIDVMCRAGKLTYQDKDEFARNVNENFHSGTFLLVVKEA